MRTAEPHQSEISSESSRAGAAARQEEQIRPARPEPGLAELLAAWRLRRSAEAAAKAPKGPAP